MSISQTCGNNCGTFADRDELDESNDTHMYQSVKGLQKLASCEKNGQTNESGSSIKDENGN